TNPNLGTLQRVQELMNHEAFDISIPNRVRSLVGAFTSGNHVQFHDISGTGYAFLADFVAEYDRRSPEVASRLIEPLLDWKKFDAPRQALMREQLRRLAAGKLSVNTQEKIDKALAREDA